MSDNNMQQHYLRAHKLMLYINVALFILACMLASLYGTWAEAILIGGGTVGGLFVIVQIAPGSAISRMSSGIAFMLMCALHIHQSNGMIEVHFGTFGDYTFLPRLASDRRCCRYNCCPSHHFLLFAVVWRRR